MQSPWAELVAWLVLPVLLAGTSAGIGLLVERIVRVELPGTLLLPVGACTAIVLLMPGYTIGLGAWFGVVVLIAATLAGVWLARDRWREHLRRIPAPAALAALAVLGLYLAPVVLTGGWTWTGYNFVNDTAFQYLLTDWVARHGIPYDEQLRSTTSETVRMYLATRYPLGTHVHMATLQGIVRAPVEVFYQAYISGLMALSALALMTLARRAGAGLRWAAAAGAVAASASLTYHYALQGNVKEIGMVLTLVTAAAGARELLTAERPRAMAVVAALPLAAAIAVYGAAAGPYVLAIGGVSVAAVLWQRGVGTLRTRLLPTAAIGLVTVVVAAAPALTMVADSFRTLQGTFSTTSAQAAGEQLAHLARPLPLGQAAGVWLGGDYRIPVDRPAAAMITDAGLVLIGVMALAGLAITLRRREVAVAALAAAGVVTYAIVAPRTSAYADAKMLAILSPAIVLCGMLGAAALARRRRWAGVGIASAIGVLVLGSAAFAYHDVRLAPTDRMRALQDLGDRYAGDDRLMLFGEYEEFAKYFMRRATINAPAEALTERHVELSRDLGFFGGKTFDLDDMTLPFVESYPAIVVRTRPNESRPPANYDLEYRNDFYAVWRRQRGPEVVAHLGLRDDDARKSVAVPGCAGLQEFAAHAPARSRLVAAVQPEIRTLDLRRAADRPRAWPDDGERPGNMVLNGPGRASGSLTVRGGRYTAWVGGSFGRPVELWADGRRLAAVEGINTPEGWLSAGPIELPAGAHRLEVRRAAGGPEPGDGARSSLGPVALVADGEPKLETIAVENVQLFCGREFDWVEIVKD